MQEQSPTQAELAVEFQKQHDAAVQQEQSAEDLVAQARKDIDELVGYSQQAIASLALVGNFAPFFDINFLTREGVTNIDAIDKTYMCKIGEQLIQDYATFLAESQQLAEKMKSIKNIFENSIAAAVSVSNPTAFIDIFASATEIQTAYVDWSDRYQRILVSAMNDIANHLNPLRDPGHQINIQ